jgi:hypothetical protein
LFVADLSSAGNQFIMRFALPAIIVVMLQTTAALGCPKRLPDGLIATPIGEQIIVNAMTLSISHVQSKGIDNAELLTRTAKTWADAGFAVKRNQAAGWDTVAAISSECLTTLQFSKASSSGGYFTVGSSKKATLITPASLGVTIPADTKTLSSVESLDSGRKGLTVAMSSPRSLQTLTQYFAEDLVKQNWKGVRPFGVVDAETGKASQRISAQRGRYQVEIMMWPGTETQIVMTIAEGL